MISKVQSRKRIHQRIRNKISGTPANPRLVVSRSNKAISCQLIDDVNSVTIASANSKDVASGGSKLEVSKKVGALIGEKAKSLGIDIIKFDRGGYLYHGRVKSLADGAREAGLIF